MDNTVLQKWLLAGVSLFVAYFIAEAIYNIYFSPLAKYPGPFLAKISSWPNFYYSTTGYRHIWIWQMHQVYGDVVRFKPSGLMLNSPTAYRTIYQTRANVKRGKFYEIWPRNSQNINTLNTVDKMVHARKRRVLNSAFSDKAVRSAEEFVKHHVDRWDELLTNGNDGGAWTEPKNMSDLSDYLVFDIMGDLCFGKSFELKEPADFMQWMYPISQSPFVNFWVWLKSRGLDKFMEKVSPKHILEYYDFVDSNVARRRKEEEALQNSGLDGKSRKDIFHYLFNTKDDAGNPAYSIDELNAEANLLIIAGSDTTATTLVGFWFYIVRHPRVYNKLVEEIRSSFKSASEIEMDTLSSCEYLQACMSETLRVAPASVGEMAREVLTGGLEFEGNVIPEGTHVGCNLWSIMYHQDYFGDPWVFRPERWIVDSSTGVTEDDVARARTCFNPFTIGVGNCPGQKVAMEELLITVARTLYRMDVRLAPGDTLGGGSPHLGWGARDKNRLMLKDAYISIKDGPMVQFRKHEIKHTPL